jgi:uncharacterized protein YcbK (DUF882 family)
VIQEVYKNDSRMRAQLAHNFQRWEFACKCGCGLADIDPEVVDICQRVRDFADQPVTVNSGCRCLKYNRSLVDDDGNPLSSDKSQHVFCKAADIVVQGVPASVVADLLDQWDVSGLGRYASFTHFDVRNGRARW